MRVDERRSREEVYEFWNPSADSTTSSIIAMDPSPADTRAARSAASGGRATSLALLTCLLMAAAAAASEAGASQRHSRVKRALYELPDGAELLLAANLRTSFSCDGLGYGYYADPDNDCRVFHVCQSFRMSDGSIYDNHWSFVCGNQTVFNQVSLSCSHPEDSVPCESARDFYYVNDYFGDPRAASLKDSDVGRAQELVSRAYGSRLARDSR